MRFLVLFVRGIVIETAVPSDSGTYTRVVPYTRTSSPYTRNHGSDSSPTIPSPRTALVPGDDGHSSDLKSDESATQSAASFSYGRSQVKLTVY